MKFWFLLLIAMGAQFNHPLRPSITGKATGRPRWPPGGFETVSVAAKNCADLGVSHSVPVLASHRVTRWTARLCWTSVHPSTKPSLSSFVLQQRAPLFLSNLLLQEPSSHTWAIRGTKRVNSLSSFLPFSSYSTRGRLLIVVPARVSWIQHSSRAGNTEARNPALPPDVGKFQLQA
ncbi:hypothetical protein B0H66DRAFT_561035 [Apodospora peruviana]|uniref:Secreted protein n=1 Tax=Apodospora peruviana TaxID=516989 RepID=A0AAE0M274_9PEZI|nr:hypothetical protein B0H66DRAFT_561035 [Apodospora peruviana]